MDKVSALQCQDHGFEPRVGHGHDKWHQYWLVPGTGLKSDLNKLWELALQ